MEIYLHCFVFLSQNAHRLERNPYIFLKPTYFHRRTVQCQGIREKVLETLKQSSLYLFADQRPQIIFLKLDPTHWDDQCLAKVPSTDGTEEVCLCCLLAHLVSIPRASDCK
jgi:hypothetical protein